MASEALGQSLELKLDPLLTVQQGRIPDKISTIGTSLFARTTVKFDTLLHINQDYGEFDALLLQRLLLIHARLLLGR